MRSLSILISFVLISLYSLNAASGDKARSSEKQELPTESQPETLLITGEQQHEYTTSQFGINCSSPDNDCVRYGDTNKDNIVNHLDLLNLGFAYGATGPSRTSSGEDPVLTYAEDFSLSFVDGLNLKHADCDGNGKVELADLNVIEQRYTPALAKTEHNSFGGGPFKLEMPAFKVTGGQSVSIPVYLQAEIPPRELYGFAFSLKVDQDFIEAGSLEFSFSKDDFGGEELINFSKEFEQEGRVDIASVQTGKEAALLGGQIGTIRFVVIDNVNGKQDSDELKISLLGAVLMDEKGAVREVSGSKGLLSVDINASIKKSTLGQVRLYPNPTNSSLHLQFNERVWGRVSLLDMSGVVVQAVAVKGEFSPQSMDVRDLNPGIYIVEITFDEQVLRQRILII